jgi:hypothetical protein
VKKAPLGRLLRSLINRRTLGAHIGAAVALGGLVALASPASAATTNEPGSAAQSYAADGTPHDGGNHHKKKNKALCIDSSQQNNEKFLAYVPERGELWIWKEGRGGPNSELSPWVQFTETADGEPTPIPEGVVCATITAHGNDVAVTIVTENKGLQQVWQTECTVNPDNEQFPFDPNTRCEEFEELTPLPDTTSGDANDLGSGGNDSQGYDNHGYDNQSYNNQAPNNHGPNTGDGATASASSGLGQTAMAGSALLGLAMIGGTVMLRRRRGRGTAEV